MDAIIEPTVLVAVIRVILSALVVGAGVAFFVWLRRAIRRGEFAAWKSLPRWRPGVDPPPTLPAWGAIVLIGSMFLFHTMLRTQQRVEEGNARQQLEEWISGPPAEYKVRIEGKEVADVEPVLRALGQIGRVHPHHSSPTNPKTVELFRGHERLGLVIAEDSSVPLEYWVFLEEETPSQSSERSPEGRYAGRVTTTVFRELLSSSLSRKPGSVGEVRCDLPRPSETDVSSLGSSGRSWSLESSASVRESELTWGRVDSAR